MAIRLLRDGCGRPGAAAGLADSDRPYRLARRLPDGSASSRCACWCRCCCCRGGLFATRLAAYRAERPTPASSTMAGRCRARCAITPSGRCSRPSSSRRSAMYAITAQIVAYLIDAGFPPLQAATAWGFSGVVLLFGMLGRIDARRHHRTPAVGAAQLRRSRSSASSCSGCCSTIRTTGCSRAFVVTFGSMIGSRGPLITATAMKIFRGERVGTIYGTISIGSGLGSGLGAWAGGLIHDWTHSYNPADRLRAGHRGAGIDPVPGRAGAAALTSFAASYSAGVRSVLFCLPVLNSMIFRVTPGKIAEIGLTRSTGAPGVPTTS